MACSKGGKRNVIVLGKTGCGKSTLAKKIICASDADDSIFRVAHSFHAVTTRIESCIERIEISGNTYEVTMIDTVGFCDPEKKGIFGDKNIIYEIKKHMVARAPEGLSLIIFVFRNGRFTEEEKEVFQIISSNFTDYIKDISCLVITGCEGLSEEFRSDVIAKFKTDPLTKQFAEIMTKGIYTVGFPKYGDLSRRSREALLEEMAEDIAPIHGLIAKSQSMYLNDEIQKDTLWDLLLGSKCQIL